ncbi:M23 family metallopeptidase [Streptomyces sp. NBC_01803]|uniref:M23 family metallopeptidase n=1 Tax=Streptomyces sp. NBC_01803 TaxID=2975946 RepID=UPI002DDBB964|nr:M23 family metallopeptidase [Streptomyces sp. NBC_01803]WSA43972.1 M23 family metallopeptidase [Streptomyces sp. NBC_01803]
MSVLTALLSILLLAAPAGPSEPGSAAPAFGAWPVPGAAGAARPLVARLWDPPPAPWAAGHRGVDLATEAGAPVVAPAAGRVSFAGEVAGRGVVTIELAGQQGEGVPPRTTLEPVRATVAQGDEVAAGDVVGTVATAGPFHCAGPCLHWGLLRGEIYLDPLARLAPGLLRSGPSRLLPTEGVPVPEGTGSVPVSR